MCWKGELPQDRETILAMIDRLKKDFSHMLDEHKAIVVQLHKLMKAAEVEKRPEYVHLAERLMLHAHTEEEVLYPAAILIGKYLKLKTGRREG